MTRRLAVTLYLISALLFLRCAGLHVHIPNPSDIAGSSGSQVMHFAGADSHGASHAQDTDVDILNTLLFKIPGLDLDDPTFLAIFFLLVLLLLRGPGHVSSGSREDAPHAAPCHTLPFSRAPPL